MIIDRQGLLDHMQVEDFIGQSVAVLGIKGSGKSNTVAVLIEEMLKAKVPVLVVDIAGEYWTMKKAFADVAVVGCSRETDVDFKMSPSNAASVARVAYESGKSVVLDMSGYMPGQRKEILLEYFQVIWRRSSMARIPLMIFLEEAHNWLPQGKKDELANVLIDIAAEGRKQGLSLVMVGQRSARIEKDTLSQADICFLHRVRHPVDMRVYEGLIPRKRRQVQTMVGRLRVGEALVLQGDSIRACKVRLRETEHVGYTPGLDRVPVRQGSLLDLLGE